MSHLPIPKTYKLYIGGAFPRSESGRVYEVTTAKGAFLANAAKASRKDARDAVVAARAAFSGWSGATAYNRGQVLYRIAELLEGRKAQFVEELQLTDGITASAALKQVDAASSEAAGENVIECRQARRDWAAIIKKFVFGRHFSPPCGLLDAGPRRV